MNEAYSNLKLVIKYEKPAKPSDVATICYTSGSTGVPKGFISHLSGIIYLSLMIFTVNKNFPGAILTHSNLISNEAAISERINIVKINFNRRLFLS
jgi:long-subunit acyl-CoA synthetase (AMP-forming)